MSMPRAIILHPNDGCLTMARALVRRGVDVHLLTTPRYAYTLASRRVAGRVMPDIRSSPEVWAEELAGLAADGAGVLLCGSDATSEWVAARRGTLPRSLTSFETGDGKQAVLMDKLRLYEIAGKAGLRAPFMHHVTTRGDLDALRDEMRFPCVLKAVLGHVAKEKLGFGTLEITSWAGLTEPAARLLDEGIDFLVTELVPGPESALEGSVAVRDELGRYPLEYGRRKVRQWPLDFGVGSLLEAASVPETMEMNRVLLDETGFVGISACETKRHSGNGELYLIETNVRVPASFGLADACGVDGSWRLYATLAGIPLGPPPPQVDGRRVMLPHKDLPAAWQRLRRGEVGVGEVLGSWRQVRDLGPVSWRDPRPGTALAAQLWRDRRRRAGRV